MFEDGFALTPIHFFPIGVDCRHVKAPFPQINEKSAYLLPSTAELCDERSFGKIYMGWNREGIELQVVVNQPVQECFYPDVSRGDGIELFSTHATSKRRVTTRVFVIISSFCRKLLMGIKQAS